MRDDVFEKYYRTMVSIINYKEKDENGNIRKCTVPVAEIQKNPERYKIFTCTHPALKKKQFAFDKELVQKHADILRKLCRILPQKKEGLSYDIWLSELIREEDPKYGVLGETFFAMCEECGIMRYFGPASQETPGAIRRNIRRTYTINL